MSFDVDEDILQDFLVEAGEILEQLQEQLVDLENNPEDADLLNAIFRGYHTVKGGAGFLSLTELVEICHGAENVFDVMRNGQRTLTPELMDIILQATDVVVEMFERVNNCIGSKRFAIKNYSRVFKKACRTVGLQDRYHFHNLRDTYAVRRWAVTGDIHLVSKEIGHKSVMTTERYADFDLETLQLDFPSLGKWIKPRMEKPTINGSFLKAINSSYLPRMDTNLMDTMVVSSS